MPSQVDPSQEALNLQRQLREGNRAQNLQDAVSCEIAIRGIEQVTGRGDWTSAFSDNVTVRPEVAKYYGGTTVSTLDYLRVNADLNRVSFEREALSALLTLGYRLEELEVEFDAVSRQEWGVCTWHKDHPSYHDPKNLQRHPGSTPEGLSYLAAMFRTERAGDTVFSLMSTQMLTAALLNQQPQFLFHKTFLYRKVVLSLPAAHQV